MTLKNVKHSAKKNKIKSNLFSLPHVHFRAKIKNERFVALQQLHGGEFPPSLVKRHELAAFELVRLDGGFRGNFKPLVVLVASRRRVFPSVERKSIDVFK